MKILMLLLTFMMTLLFPGYVLTAEKPLYVYYEIHLDNAIFPNEKVLRDVSACLKHVAEVMEKHSARATFLVRPAYARAALQSKDNTLNMLEKRGHEIGIHTHLYPNETDTVSDAFNLLKQMGIEKVISANPGFILRPQRQSGDEQSIMVEKFKKAVEDMKVGGIKIYATAIGRGNYQPYSPFRPSNENLFPMPGGSREEIKVSFEGPLVALHGVPAGAYMWQQPGDERGGAQSGANRSAGPPSDGPRRDGFAPRPGMGPGRGNGGETLDPEERKRRQEGQIPAVKEIKEDEMTSSIRPKLETAIRETRERYAGELNYFPIAIHEVEFMNTQLIDNKRVPVYNPENKGFAALDKFLSEVSDPLVRDGSIRWLTMSDIYFKYLEFEKRK